jgi:NAD-dependent dihydropyrimidine dehydrogenase PreA subunit/galactitol-specific phosphotransferase system IIB component
LLIDEEVEIMDEKIRKLLEALEKRKIACSFVANRSEAAEKVLSMIPDKSVVGIGGSMTIQELNIEESLKDKDCEVHWHWRVKKEDMDQTRRQAMMADIYLSSANAITEDGVLVNIDGTGNRVAAMVFGPGKVLIVAGKNKIAADVHGALQRIKNIACPQNSRRLKLNTPCAKTDKCHECKSPERMCNVTTLIEGKPNSVEMFVLLVGEDMGF